MQGLNILMFCFYIILPGLAKDQNIADIFLAPLPNTEGWINADQMLSLKKKKMAIQTYGQ